MKIEVGVSVGSLVALGAAGPLVPPPFGFVYLKGADGAYLKGADGAYLVGAA